jgi:valyl-tRNA synthetase
VSNFELNKTYDPKQHESIIYRRWQSGGAFSPDANKAIQDGTKAPFSIILPPPNANGHIHVGTAMFVIEDIMARYRRMQGHPTLWLPGMDHAGIETQMVYERILQADGKSRFDLGRDEFVRQVTEFTESNKSIMTKELKCMGFSLDWSRLQFTLDEPIVDTIYDTFKRMHDDGLIYRANRIVNWCPHCRSAFADIEVKYREQLDPLYYLKYGPFVLATVRPETKFGDTAIAVHPKDERYSQYVGQTISAEGLNGTVELKVIADNFVDPEFGTGVVKVTPAHDHNDWEMGLRHQLEVKQVIGTDGLLTSVAGKYAGMNVTDARQQVAKDLETHGLIDHVDMNYTHSVGYHDRCGTLIEPLTTPQWWLKVEQLKRPVIRAIEKNDVEFVPDRFKKVALDWMEHLRDWNISRQNWYGIRIPVFYNATANTSLPEYIVGTEAEAKKLYGEGNYEAESDNFDTWFSSGQWPYATLIATGDFDRFYPTSVMETGRDILFLWVTRMLMFGLYRTDKVPFTTVYLHGLITDAKGKKMSKSKGNVINPLEMTDKYGTDALRLALTIGITPGNDGALAEAKIEGYRNFCNKLWNAARFILGQLPEDYSPTSPQLHSLPDAWIYGRMQSGIASVTSSIENYRFSEAGEAIYALTWNDFADWYLEASKGVVNLDMLVYCLETILKLAHPIAPFVTEAIWGHLPARSTDLIVSTWPKANHHSDIREGQFESIRELVQAVRSVAAEEQLAKPTILTTSTAMAANADLIVRLARAGGVKQVEEGSGLFLNTSVPSWIEADQHLIASRHHRLERIRDEKRAYLKNLNQRLTNERYMASAPANIVEETKRNHAETVVLLSKLDEEIEALNN